MIDVFLLCAPGAQNLTNFRGFLPRFSVADWAQNQCTKSFSPDSAVLSLLAVSYQEYIVCTICTVAHAHSKKPQLLAI